MTLKTNDSGYGTIITTFDSKIDVTKLNYLTFAIKHLSNTSSSTYIETQYVQMGLSDDKTSTSFTDYIKVAGSVSNPTEYIFDISKITGEKYLKITVSRKGYASYVTISNIKLTKNK